MSGGSAAIVIVGAGQAGFQVAASLREGGYAGHIALIGEEPHAPYQRPPLSKAYLRTGGGLAAVALRPAAFYAAQGIEVLVGRCVQTIERANRRLRLDDGTEREYSHLVLATGAFPRALMAAEGELAGVLSLRGLDDAEKLRMLLSTPGPLAVVGGGFVGMEVAAAAANAGHRVTVIESANRLLARALTPALSDYVQTRHRAEGVRVLTGRTVHRLVGRQGRLCAIELDDGKCVDANAAVIGIGVVPNDGLARDAGLETCNGIVVDAQLRTTRDIHISAIGDCASFPSSHAGARVRLESVQNAVDQARHVARRLIREQAAEYAATPWFWTHQYDMAIQIAGLGGAEDECLLSGDPSSARFSALRFGSDGRLRCVESVNSAADHMAARRLLGAGSVPTIDEAGQSGFSLREYLRGSHDPRTPATSTPARSAQPFRQSDGVRPR